MRASLRASPCPVPALAWPLDTQACRAGLPPAPRAQARGHQAGQHRPPAPARLCDRDGLHAGHAASFSPAGLSCAPARGGELPGEKPGVQEVPAAKPPTLPQLRLPEVSSGPAGLRGGGGCVPPGWQASRHSGHERLGTGSRPEAWPRPLPPSPTAGGIPSAHGHSCTD